MYWGPWWSPPAWQFPWGVSGPGGDTSVRTAPAEDTGQEVDIYLGGDGTGGGGFLDDGGIYQAAPEYGRTLYR